MKRTIITVLFVLLVGVVGLGFYRGWFGLSSSSVDQGSNKVNVNLTMDGDKMQEDAQTVQNKTAELTGSATEKANAPGDVKPLER